MKLTKYLYIKYLFSFFVSVLTLFFLFYIFSLIGNLGEKMNFGPILYLSYLNSLQILTYIPSLVILISIVLFIILLRTKNEILIIKEYFSDIRLILIFFPIILIYAFFEINKDLASIYIDNLKSDFLKSERTHNSKIIIYNSGNKKIFTVIKGLNIKKSSIDEINTYHILKDQIVHAEYSNNVDIIDNNILVKSSTLFKENKAIKSNKISTLVKGLDKYLTNQQVYYFNDDKVKLEINTHFLIRLLSLIILFYSLFLIMLNRRVIDKKYNIMGPILVCLLLVIYFLVVSSTVLHTLNNEFFILSFLLISLIFTKYFKYE